MAYIKVNDLSKGRDGLQSPIVKNIQDSVLTEVLERTALSLAAGQKIVVQASAASVSFNAWGIEEVA